ncbi:MAG: PPOX class F420-dependent enzyme [Gammaproteobacteria bacterium]|jgi:hypothetical protein|nr:PPOX class F420-dependent enzyme [Gammaproteobacteria bacterium]|tara:strand:+ start:573 stop:965 length:393 start_codon:yes stop_codon:yes gene_type:complete
MESLKNARYTSLSTWRRNGNEVSTPVWFAAASDTTFFCFSAADAGKVKRLRNSPRARVASCDARGGKLGEWHDAKAYLVTDDSDQTGQAYALLKQKYGIQMSITNLMSRLSGRINNRAVIRIELEKVNGI